MALSVSSRAQSEPDSVLTIDLARHYFASPAAEISARAELSAALTHLGQFKGHLNSSSRLLAALRANDLVQKLSYKHGSYLGLRCSMDRADPACAAAAQINADVAAKTAFLNPEILAIPQERLQGFYAAEPGLSEYRFALDNIGRAAPHVLAPEPAELLDKFAAAITGWQYSLYGQVVSQIPFGMVQAADGTLDVIRQRNLIAASTDSRVREDGFRKRYAGYARQRELLAFALIHTAQAQDMLAKAHRYPDAPGRKYISLYFKPEQVRGLLTRIAQLGDIVKRYQRIRAQDIEQQYHQPAHPWDMSAPAPGLVPPRYSLAEARSVLHKALNGLGPEYQRAFDELLDPALGRADILPGGARNRYAGGFSVGFPGSISALFIGRYDGTFKDLSVIAHEGGHAAHRALMDLNGVVPSYSAGPNFLFESFAAFNELLLADHLASQASEPALRRYYREQWMNIKGLDAFYGAQDALLEQAIYDGVAKGSVKNADDLDNLTAKVDGQFSIFPAQFDELRTRWATMSLAYEDPLYDINYVYGGLLALKYFQLYTTNPGEFAPRYIALLKNGFDRPPAALLERFLKINLYDPALLDDALTLLGRRMDQLTDTQGINDRTRIPKRFGS
jgi:oligoendopeptidase F